MKTFEDTCVCQKDSPFHWKYTYLEKTGEHYFGKLNNYKQNIKCVKKTYNKIYLQIECPICKQEFTITKNLIID